MSGKNNDNHNRFRSQTIAFRVSPEEDKQINIAVSLSGGLYFSRTINNAFLN